MYFNHIFSFVFQLHSFILLIQLHSFILFIPRDISLSSWMLFLIVGERVDSFLEGRGAPPQLSHLSISLSTLLKNLILGASSLSGSFDIYLGTSSLIGSFHPFSLDIYIGIGAFGESHPTSTEMHKAMSPLVTDDSINY